MEKYRRWLDYERRILKHYMARPKKVVKEEVVQESVDEVKRYGIDLIGGDYGREDLNLMRDKINEIILHYGRKE